MKKLDPAGKLLLLYLITNPHTHVSGIYVLNLKHAALDSGMSLNTLSRNLDTLSGLGFCAFDADLDVLWVKKMMSYQGKGEKNQRSAAAHVAEDLHNSFLCKEFLDTYPDVKQYVKPSFIDTLSRKPDRVSGTRTPDPDSRSRSRFQNRRTEQEQDPDRSPILKQGKKPEPAPVLQNQSASGSELEPGRFQKLWGPIESILRKSMVEDVFLAYWSGIRVVDINTSEVVLAVPGTLLQAKGGQVNTKFIVEEKLAACKASGYDLLRDRKLRIVNLDELEEREQPA